MLSSRDDVPLSAGTGGGREERVPGAKCRCGPSLRGRERRREMKGSDDGSSQEEDIQGEVEEPAGVQLDIGSASAEHLSSLWQGEASARGLPELRLVQGSHRPGDRLTRPAVRDLAGG